MPPVSHQTITLGDELEAAGAFAGGSLGSITDAGRLATLALTEELVALVAPAAEPLSAAVHAAPWSR